MTTKVTATSRSSANRSIEATSLRGEDGAEVESSGRRVLALTDADFPRVLNGPAPGYAEDALRRLHGILPAESKEALLGAGRRRNRDGAMKRAPAASGAVQEAGQPLDWGAGADGGNGGGPAGVEGHVGAAVSEAFSSEYHDEEEVYQPQVIVVIIIARHVFGGSFSELISMAPFAEGLFG